MPCIPNFLSTDTVQSIRSFYEELDPCPSLDSVTANPRLQRGWNGAADRSTHLLNDVYQDTVLPIRAVIDKLHQHFGDFYVYQESIRYLQYPFPAHSDVPFDIVEMKQKGYWPYLQFMIPFWWCDAITPCTWLLSSPPKSDETSCLEIQHCLPRFVGDYQTFFYKDFSVAEKIVWTNVGDLLYWPVGQWHASSDDISLELNGQTIKEFLLIKTAKSIAP